MATLSGIWTFNESVKMTGWANLADATKEYVNYTTYKDADNLLYNYIGFNLQHYGEYNNLQFLKTSITADMRYVWTKPSSATYGLGWIYDKSRIIDFGEVEQTVSDKFYAWFTANATMLDDTKLVAVEKVEAETGVLTGTAVVADRTDVSGNIVVDGITPSGGTMTLNFTVPKSDCYVVRMYFTHNGTRDFNYVVNGKTYLISVVGTSYYTVESIDFLMYLNEGSNSVLFKGGTTGYAPMFDSFEIFEISTNITKYLVRNNDTIYTVTDGALSEITGTLNADLFINSGVDAIPDGALLMTLSNPEVLCWTDAEKLPTLTATVKGIPQPQVIVSEEINLMDGSIKGIESVTIDCKGEPVFAVSFDKKASWIMHNGTDWVNVADELTGMTKAVFEAITTEQWQIKYEASSDMYIRCTLLDETQSLTSITLNFIN